MSISVNIGGVLFDYDNFITLVGFAMKNHEEFADYCAGNEHSLALAWTISALEAEYQADN